MYKERNWHFDECENSGIVECVCPIIEERIQTQNEETVESMIDDVREDSYIVAWQ